KCRMIDLQRKTIFHEVDKLTALQGALLNEVKTRFGREVFQGFCETIGVCERSGYNYIKFYKNREVFFTRNMTDSVKALEIMGLLNDPSVRFKGDKIIVQEPGDKEILTLSIDEANALPRPEFVAFIKNIKNALSTQTKLVDLRDKSLERLQTEKDELIKKLEEFELESANEPLFKHIVVLRERAKLFSGALKEVLEQREIVQMLPENAETRDKIRDAIRGVGNEMSRFEDILGWLPEESKLPKLETKGESD
ncbi:MAG TPA: hypothetical protein PLK80_19025, partial [bacterium]|nr:hypothetical protein [bacterium]